MKRLQTGEHSVGSFFSFLLFGFFVLFLVMLILFSAEAYRLCAADLEQNDNLGTAAAYVTTKFRQHDEDGRMAVQDFQGTKALCFTDIISKKEYTTRLYLLDGQLKELFTAADSTLPADVGTTIARLSDFRIQETADGFCKIIMEDKDGNRTDLLLHSGPPASQQENVL